MFDSFAAFEGAEQAALRAVSAVSAVDGRYAEKTRPLRAVFSEGALICARIEIELAWLVAALPHLNPALYNKTAAQLTQALEGTDGDGILSGLRADHAYAAAAAKRVKELEAKTKHDVKAVEYWINEQLHECDLAALSPYVHFGCTSWDINNIALSRQLTHALRQILLPALDALLAQLRRHIKNTADTPMLSRTHGQPASPTTLGKELANFYARIAPRRAALADIKLPAKFSGATGNFNAHVVAAPQLNWPALAAQFVEQQGLRYAAYCTQIEPYDDVADLFDRLRRVNIILLDLCRDCWGYISLEYFTQTRGGGDEEAGSSTMPHKINPIDFENAEGNLGIANALLAHFADKLPLSRWQRDLSDSTVLRAIGGAFAHTLLAWQATAAGLAKVSANKQKLAADLDANWAVLTEAVQTVMRYEAVPLAYEQLKTLSRGQAVDAPALHAFIETLAISDESKARLLRLSPGAYCGLAADLAKQLVSDYEGKHERTD